MTTPSQPQNKDVLFYVLATNDSASRDAFVAKLTNKIFQQQRQCDIRFDNEQDCLRFDQVLWQFQPQAFIPHAIALDTRAPIQLWHQTISQPCQDVLLNLHPQFCDDFDQYQRTIEVLDQSEALIEMGRQRWKQYKALGFDPVVHKISST
ncbi:MAG: DNA polymerase III subunit chi [Hydrogenovibrio sp.]|nr:DNA polymerase III subunit chi [Hydrogenovibrio sp.]